MTIREFYDLTGGDYEGILERFLDDSRILKFVKMFKDDPSFEELEMALAQEKADKAFRAAHTLKGVCLNLGFERLFDYTKDVTEALREKDVAKAQADMPPLRTCYREILEAVEQVHL